MDQDPRRAQRVLREALVVATDDDDRHRIFQQHVDGWTATRSVTLRPIEDESARPGFAARLLHRHLTARRRPVSSPLVALLADADGPTRHERARRLAQLGDDRTLRFGDLETTDLTSAAAAASWWGAPLPGAVDPGTVVATRSIGGGTSGDPASLFAGVVVAFDGPWSARDIRPGDAVGSLLETGAVVAVLRRTPTLRGPSEGWIVGPSGPVVTAQACWPEPATSCRCELRIWTDGSLVPDDLLAACRTLRPDPSITHPPTGRRTRHLA